MNLDSSINFFIKDPRNYVLIVDELVIRSVPKDGGIHAHTSKIALDNLKEIGSPQADKALEAYRASIEPVKNFCNLYGLFYYKLNLDQKWLCHAWCESATTEQEFIKRTQSFEKAYNLYARGYLVEYFDNTPDLNLLTVTQIINIIPDEANVERICRLLEPAVLSFIKGPNTDENRVEIITAIDKLPLFCRASIIEAMKPYALRMLNMQILPLIIAYNSNDRAIITAVCEANPSYNEPTTKQLAFIYAAQYGLLQAVSGLLQEGHIDQNSQQRAFVDAASYGQLDIINFLLPTMPQPVRDEALLTATSRGYVSVVEMFCRLGITAELRDRCFTTACRIGECVDVISFFLTMEIPFQTIVDTAHNCSNRGQSNIAHMLWTSLSSQLARLHPTRGTPLNLSTGAQARRIYVKKSDLEENPQTYLQFVAEHGLCPVTFLNNDNTAQRGIDAGGLTKQFVTQLIEQLIAKEVIVFDDKLIPIFSSESQEINYKNFGIFLSEIAEKNVGRTDKIFTGEFCSEKTFDLLKTMLDPSLNEWEKLKVVAKACIIRSNQSLIEFALQIESTEEAISAIKNELKDLYGGDYTDVSVDQLKIICLRSIKDSQYKALAAIASGIKEPLKGKILSLGNGCSIEIQGISRPTYDQIIEKISVETQRISDSERVQLEQKVRWIKDKIKQECDLPSSIWVKRFFKCVTGQRVLPTKKIIIVGVNDHVCRAHSCFNTLYVPFSNEAPHIEDPTLTDQQRFLANLEITMDTQLFDAT